MGECEGQSIKKIIGACDSERTKRLIQMSHETGAFIVLPNKARADITFRLAKKLGLKIPKPISWDEYRSGILIGQHNGILIEDADDLLKKIFYGDSINAIAMTDDEIENL